MCTYSGCSAAALAEVLNLPHVAIFEETSSTMDRAHELASGQAPAGTLVLANRQTSGRGRHGRAWTSVPGGSVTLSLVERPTDVEAIRVLSLRLGLLLAEVLEDWCDAPVKVKWPNDLYVGRDKLAGILVESRWTSARGVDWVVIGVGINLLLPDGAHGMAALRQEVSQLDVLRRILPAIRGAAATGGVLSDGELRRWASRDWAVGRRVVAPRHGIVRGLDASGALKIEQPGGIALCSAGSLILTEE